MSRYTLEDLEFLMQRLRDPESGCPWDLEQTYASIVPHTLEEAHEVADAIEQADWPHVEEELGDLLFQVIFYAQLGREDQRFDMTSIIDALVRKLVRRHPHVFPDGQLHGKVREADISEAAVGQRWEAIKRAERAEKANTSARNSGVLDDIPLALPGLTRAAKLQKRASKVGFDWGEYAPIVAKIEEELAELKLALADGEPEAVSDEMGDLLFAQVNLARHLGVDPEQAIRGTNRKFERRFGYIEQQVRESGKSWNDFSLNQLDAWWNEAKARGL